MNDRPLVRLTLWLLPLLLLCNILFYAWFARKTRETVADEVVQKAYIVSRMLSEFSARSLDRGDLTGLRRIIEEAFRDRHIVAVGVIDPKGKVILQSTVPRVYQRLSTFETPVKLGERTVANLVTSFSLDESDELIARRLRHTAALQFGMLLLIGATLALFCRRELLAARTDGFSPSLPPRAEEMASPAAGVAEGSGERALLLLGEAERQLQVVIRAEECLGRIASWHHQAVQGSASAESLLAAGREIVTLLQGGTDAVAPAGGEMGGEEGFAGLAGELAEIAADLRRLAERSGEEGSGMGSLLSPDDSVRLAGGLAREGIATIRERVFPALAVAVAAGEDVSARLTPLLEKVAECGDRSTNLTSCSGELFDLADGIRLLRRDIPSSGDGAEGAEERLNSLAQRLESLAEGLKRDSRDLLGVANEATAAGRTILSAVENARDKLLAAGSTVEDAAAAAVMGSDHLQRFLRCSGVEVDGVSSPEPDGENLTELLAELGGRLAAAGELLATVPRAPQQPQSDYAQSLTMACDNLLLASRFLGEIAAGAAALVAAADNGVGSGADRTPMGADIGRLITAGAGRPHLSTPLAEEGCGTE